MKVTLEEKNLPNIIWELQTVHLLESEMEKVWKLEHISNTLKDLADLKRKKIS